MSNNSVHPPIKSFSSNKTLYWLLLPLCITWLVACSCGTAIEPPQKGTTTVKAAEGGTVSLSDGATLNIPAGGLTKDVEVSLEQIDDKKSGLQKSEEVVSTGNVYKIDLGVDELNQPATLTIPFDPKYISSNDVEPGQVFLSYYDEKTGKWIYAGGDVDLERKVIVLPITHASFWKPATWNWNAWIAIVNKELKGNIVDIVEANQLFYTSCSQKGTYARVEASQNQNVIQGCVEQDDPKQPSFRLVNPRAFYIEVSPISGKLDYFQREMLAPGDSLSFEANSSDPSPLVVAAQITKESTYYLMAHLILDMLPGLNELGFQPKGVACITERIKDASAFISAADALWGQNGAAVAEELSKFLLDKQAVSRFIRAADDCGFGPAKTWSIPGISSMAKSLSVIMSATDYITTYLAGNTYSELAFYWTPEQSLATDTQAPIQNDIAEQPSTDISNIVGTWQGDVTFTLNQNQSNKVLSLTINLVCHTGEPCLLVDDLVFTFSPNYMPNDNDGNSDNYCFQNTNDTTDNGTICLKDISGDNLFFHWIPPEGDASGIPLC